MRQESRGQDGLGQQSRTPEIREGQKSERSESVGEHFPLIPGCSNHNYQPEESSSHPPTRIRRGNVEKILWRVQDIDDLPICLSERLQKTSWRLARGNDSFNGCVGSVDMVSTVRISKVSTCLKLIVYTLEQIATKTFCWCQLSQYSTSKYTMKPSNAVSL